MEGLEATMYHYSATDKQPEFWSATWHDTELVFFIYQDHITVKDRKDYNNFKTLAQAKSATLAEVLYRHFLNYTQQDLRKRYGPFVDQALPLANSTSPLVQQVRERAERQLKKIEEEEAR